MKKSVFFSLMVILLITGCKNEEESPSVTVNESSLITNNGSSSITIALLDEYQLNITSDKTLTYKSDNTLNVIVSNTGLVTGNSVGEANITVSNDSESITIHVDVDLFIQPTLDFTSTKSQILSLYGEPNYIYGDSIYIYGAKGDGYSLSCWQMDFFFNQDESYKESDVYIKNNYELLLNNYVNDNFFPYDTLTINDTLTLFIYMNESTEEASTVKMGKIYNANIWGDILLYYYPFVKDQKNDNEFLPIKKSKVSCDDIRL